MLTPKPEHHNCSRTVQHTLADTTILATFYFHKAQYKNAEWEVWETNFCIQSDDSLIPDTPLTEDDVRAIYLRPFALYKSLYSIMEELAREEL